ncbi:hypothetical protein [Aeromonas hydrophila]|uniref:hypothetical protein n=1 Tax=Aeromonas hydrophila TaxID=644 RepID=UPI00188EB668|nr:hypothetical protein [Aeromonas hydrophila]MBF4801474.1 hypothetical protein [Aeromonas hydrophila]
MNQIVLHGIRLFPWPRSSPFLETLPPPGSELPGAELILFCSSGEVEVLQQPWMVEWMSREERRMTPPRRAFVSMACASWYAAMLEFMRSDCCSAEIWVIEACVDFIQERMDCAGLGRGGEGLLARGGVACISLRKVDSREHGVRLAACALFAKPAGLQGTELLIKRYAQWISAHQYGNEHADWVSFSIETHWSRQLLAGLALWGKDTMGSLVTLPSLEQGKDHYMALKPLHELATHLQRPLVRSVILTTLAAGGKIGCAIFSNAEGEPMNMLSDICPIRLPFTVLPAGVRPRYCERAYRYRDNEYFLTELDESDSALLIHS